jgi:hypothetical protein
MKKLLVTTIVLLAIVAVGYGVQKAYADIYDTGLVGWWNFDSNQISGTTVNDLTATNNDGTMVNTPTQTFGKIGQSLSYDHTQSEKVTLASNYTDQQGTISAWVKTASGQTGTSKYIMAYYLTSTTVWDMFAFAVGDGNNVFFQKYTGSPAAHNVVQTTAALNSNWNHVAGTSNGSTWLIYINGKLAATSVITGSNTGQWAGDIVTAGTKQTGVGYNHVLLSDYYWGGNLDDVRYYNRVLTANDVAQLYQSGFPKHNNF